MTKLPNKSSFYLQIIFFAYDMVFITWFDILTQKKFIFMNDATLCINFIIGPLRSPKTYREVSKISRNFEMAKIFGHRASQLLYLLHVFDNDIHQLPLHQTSQLKFKNGW